MRLHQICCCIVAKSFGFVELHRICCCMVAKSYSAEVVQACFYFSGFLGNLSSIQ